MSAVHISSSILSVLRAAGLVAAAAIMGVPASAAPVPQYFGKLAHPPLDPPLALTGTFGEHRGGHFHAGLDFSTGEEVGRPVYAALPGRIVRVRASGAGYGRSIYLEADDGRLLVYGHLDAFAEPLAAYVAAKQDSAGVYEQDLWPEPARFRVRAGQRLGWSGRSGTGPPHLHFEIRRGDVAYNPLLAGVTLADTTTPRIARVMLVPLDDTSYVARGEGGQDADEPGHAFTLHGRARLVVEAVDARANGRWTMAPWSTAMTAGGHRVECRFDSVSWAEGMTEVDFVYDRGRTLAEGQYALHLGAPAGFRPRVIATDLTDGLEAGTLTLPDGVATLPVALEVRDAAGNVGRGEVVVHRATGPAGAGALRGPVFPAWPIAPIDFRGVPGESQAGGRGEIEWTIPAGAWFEPATVRSDTGGVDTTTTPLRRVSGLYALWPALQPLRGPFRISMLLRRDAVRPRVALYRNSGEGWEWVGAEYDSIVKRYSGTTRRFGRFALFEDLEAPGVSLVTPARRKERTPYPRWSLEAALEERGSGVDARRSSVVVDGRRVPAEWDGERGVLRWTPRVRPRKGSHRVEVIAMDRAGNTARREGTFVLD